MQRTFARGRGTRLVLLLLLGLAAGRAGAAASHSPRVAAHAALRGRPVLEIRFVGNLHIQDGVIRRELYLQPGDAFDPEQLERDVNFLKGLGILAAVDVEVLPRAGGVDLRYAVKERADIRYGLLYPTGSVDGDGRVKAGFVYRHRNLAGGRETLWLEGSEGREQELILRLAKPWLRDLPLEHGFDFNYRFREEDDPFRHRRARLHLALALRRQRPLEHRFLLSVSWGRRDFERDGRGEREKTSNLSLGYAHDTRDSFLRPRAGGQLSLVFALFHPRLDSSRSLVQMYFRWTRYRRLREHLTGAFSVDGGNQWGELFYQSSYSLGGMDVVRGYDDGAVDGWAGDGGPGGPRGRNRLLLRGELRRDLLRPYTFDLPHLGAVDAELEGLLFADAGWLWSEPLPLIPAERRAQLHGVGVGLRLHTPIGDVLRAELALGEGGRGKLHLGAGLSF